MNLSRQTLQQALWIPTQFALEQIPNLDVEKTMTKLKQLHDNLLRNTLLHGAEHTSLTPKLSVSVHDLLELFSGDYFDQITPQGMATLKKMHQQDYLEFVGVKTNFPDALNEYLASSIEPIAPRYEEFNSLSNTLKDEKTFTYRDLYYLFESVAGNKLGCVKLRIGQTSVTRQTHRDQCASNDKTYQTVFIWENDACRTCKLGREGLL